MKVSYKDTIGGAYAVLFDETAVAAGPMLEKFTPNFKALNQVEPLLGGTNQFSTPRGNIRCTLPMTITATYADLPSALASVRTFAALLGFKWHFKIEQGAEAQYYPNALVEGYTPALTGATVVHQLSFTSDTVTATPP